MQAFIRDLPIRVMRWKSGSPTTSRAAIDAYVERLRRLLYAIVDDAASPPDDASPPTA